MPRCSYCKKEYSFPKGLTFVKKDGTVLYFCSSKCRKNMFMKRRKVRWLLKSKKEKSKELKSIKKESNRK